jgi:hypothetical protein
MNRQNKRIRYRYPFSARRSITTSLSVCFYGSPRRAGKFPALEAAQKNYIGGCFWSGKRAALGRSFCQWHQDQVGVPIVEQTSLSAMNHDVRYIRLLGSTSKLGNGSVRHEMHVIPEAGTACVDHRVKQAEATELIPAHTYI